MTPPCHSFPASQLPVQIQINLDGKKRKTEGGKSIDLSACELLDLVQYRCKVDDPEKPKSVTRCWPVQRWFRRCQDKKGSFMVETTAWEGAHAATTITTTTTATTTTAMDSQPATKSTTQWHDGNKTDYFSSEEL